MASCNRAEKGLRPRSGELASVKTCRRERSGSARTYGSAPDAGEGATVIEEDADAVGISILSGAHMTLVPRIVELLREQGGRDVAVTVGGTIPPGDIARLKELGVGEVFTPGARWRTSCASSTVAPDSIVGKEER